MSKLTELALEQVDTITDAGTSVVDHNFYMLLEAENRNIQKEKLSDLDAMIMERYAMTAYNSINYRSHSFILFNVYKLSEIFNHASLKNFECDCCKGVTQLFKEVYSRLDDFVCEPESTMKYQLRQANINLLFKGDTMTSVWTPLKGYLRLKYDIQPIYKETEEDLKSRYHIKCCLKEKAVATWALYFLDKFRFYNDLPEFVLDFISYGCSFANFIPVPQGFNDGRSNWGKWDSWDLALAQIYQWYLDNPQMTGQTNDCALEELFTKNIESAVLHCTEWLKMFHSWENFVEQNHMQAFVQPDGQPKKFFPNHTLEYGLPKTLEEYEEFFQNAVSCIKERADSIDELINAK